MKRDYPFTVALVLLAMVLLAIAMILYQRTVRLGEENERLRGEVAAAAETQTQRGGAESDMPPAPQPISSEWTFPIAESDYRMLTSPFGYRVSPILGIERYHDGVDISTTWRAQVVAIADGVVSAHWPPPGTPGPDGIPYRGHEVFGGLVVLEHENGWQSFYAHLHSTRVHTGQVVAAGEIIGRVGNTGQSDGDHLHVGLKDATGRPVNPLLYLEAIQESNDGE